MSAYTNTHLCGAHGDEVSMSIQFHRSGNTLSLRMDEQRVSLTLSREQFSELAQLACEGATVESEVAA